MPDQPLSVRIGEGVAAGAALLFGAYWKFFRSAKETSNAEVAREVQRLVMELRIEYDVFQESMTYRVAKLEDSTRSMKRELRDAVDEIRESTLSTMASFQSAIRRFEHRLGLPPAERNPPDDASQMDRKL